MAGYDPQTIEAKWQKAWLKAGSFAATEDSGKKKKYVLDMFPYPSGDGLHVGHVKIYTGSDVSARYWRMKGFTVLHPMGWDAFGLPAEQSAIKFGLHPRELTERNVTRFKQQMQMMGFSYDWDREINTTDPAYYKWTQWIFLKLFARGLAYEADIMLNWCPALGTVLADEEVVDGKSEVGGHPVEKRPMRQWMLKITAYADRLLEGLEQLDWPQFIIELQRNWIGRKVGIDISYTVEGSDEVLTCFTTRPDTNFGATFIVLAPEHSYARKVAEDNKEVAAYVKESLQKSALERQEEGRDKTGVFTGQFALNQLNSVKLPIWVSDFVLGGFGTGAVVGVPGHDQRDFAFAQQFDLPVRRVVVASAGDDSVIERIEQVHEAAGTLINSEFLNGLSVAQAIEAMMDHLEKKGWGTRTISYSLRDWVFSRQRYWGEPIPLIHCAECGVVPVPEEDLPVTLPEIAKYEPTGTGESPLAAQTDWVKVSCPKCGQAGKRETNTMPQWAGSSWYYLRYLDPHNSEELVSKKALAEWMPVDIYVGGAEHAVLHLLYARFWHKVLYDEGVVLEEEPFVKLRNVGLLMGPDNQKMSKSRGNVIVPDDIVQKYGADALRVYEMFIGPFNQSAAWSSDGIAGIHRFLARVFRWYERELPEVDEAQELTLVAQRTIARVTDSIEQFRFNTGVAALMEMLNELEAQPQVSADTKKIFLLLLSPYAPHLAHELYERLGDQDSIGEAAWPVVDEALLKAAAVTIAVQVNGRVRGVLKASRGTSQQEIEAQARTVPNVAKYLRGDKEDKEDKGDGETKVIFVPDRLINFVVSG
ncbi:leucine--tRNA ligase [Patescibacteria group bacterium]|nr:leucine--tRNA ligase [Patescibacteria group bacterium]